MESMPHRLAVHVGVRFLRPEEEQRCAEIMTNAAQIAYYWTRYPEIDVESFRAMTAGETVIVADSGRDIVGFAGIYQPARYIHHLFVHPAAQRAGVGTALLTESRRLTGGTASLKCQTRNESARRFYAMQGWHEDPLNGGADEYGDWLWIRAPNVRP
jgi:GNAT superfamily N-acetyltransferase